jgi:hypothetical protein
MLIGRKLPQILILIESRLLTRKCNADRIEIARNLKSHPQLSHEYMSRFICNYYYCSVGKPYEILYCKMQNASKQNAKCFVA